MSDNSIDAFVMARLAVDTVKETEWQRLSRIALSCLADRLRKELKEFEADAKVDHWLGGQHINVWTPSKAHVCTVRLCEYIERGDVIVESAYVRRHMGYYYFSEDAVEVVRMSYARAMGRAYASKRDGVLDSW